jgi:hypothetical protein
MTILAHLLIPSTTRRSILDRADAKAECVYREVDKELIRNGFSFTP